MHKVSFDNRLKQIIGPLYLFISSGYMRIVYYEGPWALYPSHSVLDFTRFGGEAHGVPIDQLIKEYFREQDGSFLFDSITDAVKKAWENAEVKKELYDKVINPAKNTVNEISDWLNKAYGISPGFNSNLLSFLLTQRPVVYIQAITCEVSYNYNEKKFFLTSPVDIRIGVNDANKPVDSVDLHKYCMHRVQEEEAILKDLKAGTGIMYNLAKVKYPSVDFGQTIEENLKNKLPYPGVPGRETPPTHREFILAHEYKVKAREASPKTAGEWKNEVGAKRYQAFYTLNPRSPKYSPPKVEEIRMVVELLEGFVNAKRMAMNDLDKLEKGFN